MVVVVVEWRDISGGEGCGEGCERNSGMGGRKSNGKPAR